MVHKQRRQVLALSGGVGGAKLALGLTQHLGATELTVVANTADDFEHLGLSICPDLDTVMYTLAELSNKEQGWGIEGESWSCMSALAELNGPTWFRLGDRDIATHLQRSQLLRDGVSLTETTGQLNSALGVSYTLLPMSDDPVRTFVQTAQGELPFQQYFVGEQCAPEVTGFYFQGIEQARPQPDWMQLLAASQLAAIIICPSNPFVSVDPMLRLCGVREAMRQSKAPVIAVSPIVGGSAIKGPAAKMFTELGLGCSAIAVAEFYGDLLDGFVIDNIDVEQQAAIEALGIPCLVTNTVMKTLEDRALLAQQTLAFAERLTVSQLAVEVPQ
ncbi:LPPG:FO 2-phospho-L-lactate transferase [Sinobacterium caligoides]|uniref:LPPG:FO 2-phospho-L-lactate transferase n=1 Tax=Sinobacterium caligoides TaxID=933926 RepID=A0A3N2DN93_9GAMM|nr:2-phospho-L-lactate transferase [Sinobacterium caligoides]ROS01152.1 LPPG:FO 2-phospho-L-lactate transferase [Sinobacterium caligoides]